MQTYSKTLSAADPVLDGQLSPGFDGLEIVQATGTLTVKFAGRGGDVLARKGDTLRFDLSDNMPQGFSITSSVVGDVLELRACRGISFHITTALEIAAALVAAGVGVAPIGNTFQAGVDTVVGAGAGPVALPIPAAIPGVLAYVVTLDYLAPGPIRIGNAGSVTTIKGTQLMPGATLIIPISMGDAGGAPPNVANPNGVPVTVTSSQIIKA